MSNDTVPANAVPATLAATIDAILAGDLRPESVPTEADWHDLWTARALGTESPIVTSVTGGALADRLPWVFVSGYQAAVAHAFPELPSATGWSCLAASEDREHRLPGATLSEDDGTLRLSGAKTWIAASDHVERLVVTVGFGADHRVVAVDRASEGVTIETYDRARFLGDLTQGRATFEATPVTLELPVPEGGRGFGAAEPLHVLTAINACMLSHTLALGGPASLAGQALAAIHNAAALAERPLTDGVVALGLAGLDVQTQSTAEEFEALVAERAPDLHQRWTEDRRLVGMYGAGISKFAQAVADRATAS